MDVESSNKDGTGRITFTLRSEHRGSVLRLKSPVLMVAAENVPVNSDEVDSLDRISACFSNSFSMGSVHSSAHA